MKKHTKIYLEARCGEVPTEPISCEVCLHNGEWSPVVDIHHIGGRGSGGSKLLDIIEKLAGVCRACHNDCEDGTYSEEEQLEMHELFLLAHRISYSADRLYATKHELTNLYKNGEL